MKIFLSILTLVIVTIFYMVIKNNIKPNNIGVLNGRLSDVPKSPNNVSTETSDKEKKVEPLDFIGSMESSKEKVENILKNYGGVEILVNENGYIYAVFKTEKMGFKDDVEFYFDDNNKEIQYRSASRVGYSDMGLNRKRYEEIRELYYK